MSNCGAEKKSDGLPCENKGKEEYNGRCGLHKNWSMDETTKKIVKTPIGKKPFTSSSDVKLNDNKKYNSRRASPPRVVASRASPPRVVASRASPPRVVASRASPPRVVASRASPPRVVASRASPPRVVASRASPPRVVASRPSSPRVVASRFNYESDSDSDSYL
jgi:hypothetical protein